MIEQFYWESDLRRDKSGTPTRKCCLIYERTNPDPIASCANVDVANEIVDALNGVENKP